MIVISDTNILSSFAAGDAFHPLFQLFTKTKIHTPPSVKHELQAGIAHGHKHLKKALESFDRDELQILKLSKQEQKLANELPKNLNVGECEAIALSKVRKGQLLTNDKRAVRYCKERRIKVLDLAVLLRLLWTRGIVTQEEVNIMLKKMKEVENLQLSRDTLDIIFAQS